MLSSQLPRVAAGDDSGFTLIELIVAMLISGVIVVVLLAFLSTTTTQTTTLSEKVQSTRLGRQTMTKVLDELHSACIASGSTGYYPVREKSTATTLYFDNAYSKQAAIPSASESASEGVYEHRLTFEEGTKKIGPLVDYSYPSTSLSAWPVPTINKAAPSTHRLGENLAETTQTVEKVEKIVPFFQYYKYATAASSTTSSTAGVGTLALMTPPTSGFSAAEAQEVAAVDISFTAFPAFPSTLTKEPNRAVPVSSQVTFAFTAPSAEGKIEDSPCE
jgi:prepilin-type N-terminal cleavage/methylation domain-containing protein